MAMMEGYLSKWTNVVKGWQFRWFVLDDNAGLLSYYISKEKMMRGVRRGCVRLKGAVIGIDDDDDSTFTITVDAKIFHFQARDPDERDRWIRALEDTILRHAQFHQKRWNPNEPVPTVQDFDKKLTETDAYLQILIEQVKNLETRLEKCDDEAERHQCLVIRDRANEMLDSIKHSIVLLQIAKNTAHPVNGIYQRKTSSRLSEKRKQEYNKESRKCFSNKHIGPSLVDGPRRVATIPSLVDAPLDVPIEPGIEPAVECLEEGAGASIKERLRATSSTALDLGMAAADVGGTKSSELTCAGTYKSSFQPVVPPGPSPAVILPIPETSYSSSEDEDYYDAKDDEDQDEHCAQSASGRRLYADATDSLDSTLKSTSSANSVLMDGRIDFDDAQKGLICGDESIYEDDDEEELGSVESHGSVISHLLSQVKLGMDLTKVVLPTFILERRSLLEMYADFFAHPDLFVSIADFSDPKDRMVQVVRWYMSAFHAGRKSSVAKKPYNPILGETFRCYWDVPGIPESQETVADGPLPWATKNQLAFIAEQVSHHPPISAFYAEHYNKRISFCAHIWTKSKFLGLSIGVHMIGQGCISVLDSDEEYIISFPNGYGRSILSVPWVELGGTTTVSCAKTGYNANVSFLTKPFYGGKKHRVTAEVFQPSDKKPFLTVSGEWNGSMHAKWADGEPTTTSEEFVDTTRIDIIKKNVQPVANQEEFESRRLWKDVTAGLRLKNIEKATESKFHLEQRQRMEAKERKDRGTKWETKCFHDYNGENWIYDYPLVKRLASAAAAAVSSTAVTTTNTSSSLSTTTTTTAEQCRTELL